MAPKTILLVDDDADSRTICLAILSHHGYRVVEAASAEDGIRLADELLPDAILMDVSLPVMDGWSATAHLKSRPRTSPIPVIMFTACALESDRAHGSRVGCDAYLTKPCAPAAILQEVSRFVDLD